MLEENYSSQVGLVVASAYPPISSVIFLDDKRECALLEAQAEIGRTIDHTSYPLAHMQFSHEWCH